MSQAFPEFFILWEWGVGKDWGVEEVMDLLTGVIPVQGVDSQRGSSGMKKISHCLHCWLVLGATLR